ncbi:MAG: HrpE/YscL family type III secretion apparatus protein [Desulfovibrionaceae bacterium]|nr:HrpE/YscL family type III secretion apparatus protein [Desulfovibrionaceae bacterium]
MDPIFFLTHNQIGVSSDVKILKAEDYARFFESRSIMEDAKRRAQQIIEMAQEEYKIMQQRGFEAGLEDGKKELAAKMIEQIAAGVDYFASIESTMVDIVTTAIEKIIGKMEDKDRINAIVHKALNYVRQQKKVLIRLSPEDLPFVQENLNEIVRTYPGISFLDITPDTHLARGDCILESDIGIINASINSQIEAIRTAFIKHLSNKTSNTRNSDE